MLLALLLASVPDWKIENIMYESSQTLIDGQVATMIRAENEDVSMVTKLDANEWRGRTLAFDANLKGDGAPSVRCLFVVIIVGTHARVFRNFMIPQNDQEWSQMRLIANIPHDVDKVFAGVLAMGELGWFRNMQFSEGSGTPTESITFVKFYNRTVGSQIARSFWLRDDLPEVRTEDASPRLLLAASVVDAELKWVRPKAEYKSQ